MPAMAPAPGYIMGSWFSSGSMACCAAGPIIMGGKPPKGIMLAMAAMGSMPPPSPLAAAAAMADMPIMPIMGGIWPMPMPMNISAPGIMPMARDALPAEPSLPEPPSRLLALLAPLGPPAIMPAVISSISACWLRERLRCVPCMEGSAP
jgi:hypothetical protein